MSRKRKFTVAFFITVAGITVWLLTNMFTIWVFGRLGSTPTKDIWLDLLFFGTLTGYLSLSTTDK